MLVFLGKFVFFPNQVDFWQQLNVAPNCCGLKCSGFGHHGLIKGKLNLSFQNFPY
jgi:hypothetical protein